MESLQDIEKKIRKRKNLMKESDKTIKSLIICGTIMGLLLYGTIEFTFIFGVIKSLLVTGILLSIGEVIVILEFINEFAKEVVFRSDLKKHVQFCEDEKGRVLNHRDDVKTISFNKKIDNTNIIAKNNIDKINELKKLKESLTINEEELEDTVKNFKSLGLKNMRH